MLEQNTTAFKVACLEYIEILEKARLDDMGNIVQEALDQINKSQETEEAREAFEECWIRLLSIEDPFDRWRAFTKEISKVWPDGVSAVDAIREQRDKRNH